MCTFVLCKDIYCTVVIKTVFMFQGQLTYNLCKDANYANLQEIITLQDIYRKQGNSETSVQLENELPL